MSDSDKCHKCQFENQADAKFCSNCGSELALQKVNNIVCKSCGFSNKIEANFCASCGSKLSRKARNKSGIPTKGETSRQKKSSPQKASKKAINPFFVGAAIVVFFILYLLINGSRESASNSPESFQPSIEKKTNNVELENNVHEVASKFVCACSSCAEEPLESCSCETAQEERQFIRTALQQGQSVDEVIRAVNLNYGWIRDEYKSQYGNGKLSLDVNSKLSQLVPAGKESANQASQPIATMADRTEIISRFTCPCGQCEDALSICDCEHPGGAKEIKQFVDEKIARGKYTTDQIIEFVDHKYASRIR